MSNTTNETGKEAETLEEACNQESRFYNALNGQERIVYITGAKFGAERQSAVDKAEIERLVECLAMVYGYISSKDDTDDAEQIICYRVKHILAEATNK